MTVFCLILLVLSFVALTAEIIMRSVLKIKNFGVEREWLLIKGKTIPVEDFLPHNIFESLIFVFSFAVLGMILTALSMPAAAAVFCCLCFGALVLFAKKHLVFQLYVALKGEGLPKDFPDIGASGVCIERIAGDGYGRISFDYKGRAYTINAVSVNETDIEEGEPVTVVHKEEEVCWVERVDEELNEVEE